METPETSSCYYLLPVPKATFHPRKWATDVTLKMVSSNCIFFTDLKLHTWSTNQVSVMKLLTESLLWLIYVTTRATHLNFFHLFRAVIPEMDIFSSPPNRTLRVGADINLTCIAWPRNDHQLYPIYLIIIMFYLKIFMNL